MVEFVGFTPQDAEAIKATHLIIEKYIPEIVSKFYSKLLSYPPTRKIFSKKDGSLDQEYLQLRMHHLTNFWRRTASGVYDDDYARFVDYVGRAHTHRGADPKIYIPERYVIGQVGLVQHIISEALHRELSGIDPELEVRASRAWNLLMMVILEMLARAYSDEDVVEGESDRTPVDADTVHQLAVQIYERNLGMYRSVEYIEVNVGRLEQIAEGERQIVEVQGVSIGIFHHKGRWYALRNSCLHRGGPVCAGPLKGDALVCPWHGYQYNVTNGELLLDPSAHLETYPVEVRDGDLFLRFPLVTMDSELVALEPESSVSSQLPTEQEATEARILEENEFLLADIQPGQIGLVTVDDEDVAVYNVGGSYYATHNNCTHAEGPLNEGELEGYGIVCPWHDSCFDIRDGSVLRGPAKEPVRTYRVVVEGSVGRVE
jgi:nitrite reductase/ring-hydroxylating ferredoxin subunit/hemoglobin-like flavoprotein